VKGVLGEVVEVSVDDGRERRVELGDGGFLGAGGVRAEGETHMRAKRNRGFI
jgi:hypothetical protein